MIKIQLINSYQKKISVIVCSNDRKNFIVKAAESVSKQTMPRNEYEIIIIKNFKDISIDAELQYLSDKVINLDSEWQGEKWWAGIKIAKGKILCFLDDDDIFSEDKLKRVWESYNKFKFNYFRDNMKLFAYYAPSNSIYKDNLTLSLDKNLYTRKRIRLISKKITKISSSNTTVEREMCLKFENAIKNVKIAFDAFVFYMAIETGAKIVLDLNIMTFYRVHNSYTNINESNSTQAVAKIVSNMKVFMEDYQNIGSIISNHILKHFFLNDLFEFNFLKCLFANEKRQPIKTFFHFMMYPSPGRLRMKLFFSTLYIISLFSLQKARMLYISYLNSFTLTHIFYSAEPVK